MSTQKVARSTLNTLLYPQRRLSSIRAAFRDPTSPFYIEKGSEGPASPDEQPTTSAAEEARKYLVDHGFDPASFWEQPISWGDHDAFQHVNNVNYRAHFISIPVHIVHPACTLAVRYFENSRIRWVMSVGHDTGGPAREEALLKPQGIAFILKSMEVKYRRPVRYPDTLLVASKPAPEPDSKHSRTQFLLFAKAYSYEQRAVVADLKSVLTWYDY
ncbi:Thioesterase/thiol ester dehydrase-isomerase [Lactarius hatsudake]|nr:Thioesterase/thiol ester dehydrase-isomerase [Lactarius hatsudake]